jgi:hypothetical protein
MGMTSHRFSLLKKSRSGGWRGIGLKVILSWKEALLLERCKKRATTIPIVLVRNWSRQ